MTTQPSKLRLGALLFEGFELLDLYGALEMFAHPVASIEIVTVAESAGGVPSGNQAVKGFADLSIHDAGPLDMLLIPGGYGTRREVGNQRLLEWIRETADKASYVATVCTGTALLAKSGVLDGRKATTNKRAFKWVASQGPAVTWIPEARWVEDGKFFTSSGVSAGMDMALGLIARIRDRETAVAIAHATEYHWQEDKSHDPFARLNGLVPSVKPS